MYTVIIAIQVLGIVILVGEIIYLFTRNASRLQLILLMMSVCVFMNFLGETGEILSSDPSAAIMGVRFSYLGKPFIVFMCLVFLIEYCRIRIPRWVLYVLLDIQLSVSVMAFTCPYQDLYYTSIGWTEQGLFPHLVLGKSPLYWFYSVLIGAYLAGFMVIIVRQFRRSKTDMERNQAKSLFAMIAIMAACLGIYLTGVTAGYDLTLVGYTVTLVILVHAILRFNLFETMTLARERALQDSEDGLVVMDQRGDVIYVNSTAAHILGIFSLGEDKPALVSDDVVTLELVEKLNAYLDQDAPVQSDDRYFSTNLRELNEDGTFYGSIYELKDVTDSYTYATRLEHDVEEKAQEIRRMQREITIGFANMVEARDGVTGAHVKNTSAYVRIIASSLSEMAAERFGGDPARMRELWGTGYEQILEPDFVTTLAEAAPLHDLGKIAVPDSILCKPGKLTEEEFEVMKTHAAKGAEVIQDTLSGIESEEYVHIAQNVARHHHEKWNGCGYPDGLSGADIPLSARIMAIADVYDALRSKRSYKEPFSAEKARGIIEGDAGAHFDPILVQAFTRAIDEIEAV